MEIVRLTAAYEMKPFDCGDADLNGFLLNDAKMYLEKKLAFTFILEDAGNIVAYYSLLNDKVAKRETTNAAWRKMKKLFPHQKHFNSYPAVKIGRLAVSIAYRGQGIGTELVSMVKQMLVNKSALSACRFLTVDAYKEALPFYVKNGFKTLVDTIDDDSHTIPMYYDLKGLLD